MINNKQQKYFIFLIGSIASIISLLSVFLGIFNIELLFKNIQLILGVLISFIIAFITTTAYLRIKSFETDLKGDMKKLINQTHEIEHRLVETLKDSTVGENNLQGFLHLRDKVEKFVELYPFEKNVAFLASYSGQQSDELYYAIKQTLNEKDYRLLRVSDQMVASDLFSNVIVHLLGSKYGIAIFEGSEEKNWANPNVAFELGIMFTLGRKVLLLKDSHLPKIPTDLTGHIYNEYRSSDEIPDIIKKWLYQIEQEEALTNKSS